MSYFEFRGGALHAEDVALCDIARRFGTPCYVYSRAAFESQWQILDQAFGDYPHSICYAVKANSNIAVLNLLARLGSGFDIVSSGELHRVLLAGGEPEKVVYSGVAKSTEELHFVLANGVRNINIESSAELIRLQRVAVELNITAQIAVRVNPNVDAQTHPYIATGLENSKFGITMEAAIDVYRQAAEMSHIQIHGIACHIGSQITKLSPFADSLGLLLELAAQLSNLDIKITQLDLGGGLGIDHDDKVAPSAEDYINTLLETLRTRRVDLPISIEPGRFIAGNSGVLLSRVEYLKRNANKRFVVVDAGMNDLLRPSLYQAHHDIVNVNQQSMAEQACYDVVGPVCESSDVLGYDRLLKVDADDLLAMYSAGAYSFSMASNYNSRRRPAEVMVDCAKAYLVRERETYPDLTRGETLLPE